MSAVALLIFLAGIEISMAAVDDCPGMHYWNGTQCVICSKCPPGFGLKVNCSAKRDTQCQACLPGYDYSGTNSFQECILCDTYSNCLPGNHKTIKNCTIFSKPVCDGCAEGNFFDPNVGMNGGCVECSPPCSPLEVETRRCSTKHDRACEVKSLGKIPILGKSTTNPPKEIPNSTTEGEKVQPEDPALAANGTKSPATAPSEKKPVLWIGLGVGSTILVIAFVVALICRKRNYRRKRDATSRTNTTRGEDPQQVTPLMQQPAACGLDLPIKNLSIGGRRFIAKKLNGKYPDCYFFWQMTADKVGLGDECESWRNNDGNPAEKFLTVYGEKEGSTIRNLINVLRDPEVELTLIAKEIEDKFSPPQDQDEPAQPKSEAEPAEPIEQGEPGDRMAQGEPATSFIVDTYV